jgi:hypothetical protein
MGGGIFLFAADDDARACQAGGADTRDYFERAVVKIDAQPHFAHRQITSNVVLAEEAKTIMLASEFDAPPMLVACDRREEEIPLDHLFVGTNRIRRSIRVGPDICRGGERGGSRLLKRHELRNIVWPACFESRSDG